MHASQHCRDTAVDCLLAARDCPPYYRELHLCLAAIWLSLAHQESVLEDLLASRDTAKPVKTDGLCAHPRPLLYLVR
jgi:hypothetical protein